jgi:hypothetical protein
MQLVPKTPRSYIIWPAFFLVCAVFHSIQAIEVAKFAYKFAPENLNNRTLRVDGDMVAMSENIFAQVVSSGNDTHVDTPSIFFIIDNSASMGGTRGTDQNGNRFTVTAALLDTLQKNYPAVEVGLAIFGSTLFADTADTFYLVSCPGQSGAYVPLVQLSKIYTTKTGAKTGYTILKEILATNNGNLIYQPSNSALNQTSTNITAGFDAAKDAFKTSINAANHERQFAIFLSDGEANRPDSTTNRAETFRFVKGINIPTTFTVFFSTSTPPTVPRRLDTMTTNIRNNGWSTNNPKSAYWGYQNTTQTALMDFLMTNVLTVITTNSRATPKSISLGGTTVTAWMNGMFTFPALFPLTAAVTTFNYSITYSIYKNSTFIKDTVHSISNLNIRIDPAVTLPADSFDVRHWDRNLNLRYNNARITTVTETMDSLELVFDFKPGTALYNYTNIKVQVYNQLGAIRDNETYALTRRAGTDTFSLKFMKAVSTLPIPGNKVFEIQGTSGDNLVAVFRNSETSLLPLDTLQITVPLNVTPLAQLTTAITRDLDGDGFIDHIQVSFNKGVTLTNAMIPGFLIKGNSHIFPIDSISRIGDSTYLLDLKEIKTTLPQTSWTPDLSITFIRDIQPVVNFKTTDGCPPVVWEVKKYIADSSRSHDTVRIFLSEKIFGADGGAFSLQTLPSDAFNTWIVQGTSLAPDDMFAGISGFTRIEQDSILVLVMSNGKDLSTDNYINIRNEKSLIADKTGNFPTSANQRVRVTIAGVIFTMYTGPNPAHPTLNHPEPMDFKNEPNAIKWVQQGQGTVISLQNLTRPLNPDDAANVKGTLKIIDVVGNTVNWCSTENLFATVPNSGGTAPKMNLYWNGLNHEGMIVAPGVYRVVVYINYPSNAKIPNSRVISKIGINR